MLQAISPFLTMFSILYGTYFSFLMHFKMSSAIRFNLDQSKILSSGDGLKPSPCNPVSITQDLKIEGPWFDPWLSQFLSKE